MSGFEGGLISEVPSFDGETASTVGSTLTAFGFCLAFRLGASPPPDETAPLCVLLFSAAIDYQMRQ